VDRMLKGYCDMARLRQALDYLCKS